MIDDEKKAPCRACLSIRIFLFSVCGLIIVALIDRSLLSGIAKLSPFAIAVSLVSILGFFAILKALVEFKQSKSKPTK
jgi:disulfide bond formation protein DsbB